MITPIQTITNLGPLAKPLHGANFKRRNTMEKIPAFSELPLSWQEVLKEARQEMENERKNMKIEMPPEKPISINL
jgi:hypothetical protein